MALDRAELKALLDATIFTNGQRKITAAEHNNLVTEIINSVDNIVDDTEPNTWYVNTNGDDGNVGSDKFPFAEIQFAHDVAASGDTIILQNNAFSSSAAVSITKDLTIKGLTPYTTDSVQIAAISGDWTISISKKITFQNLHITVAFISTGTIHISVTDCLFRPASITNNDVSLNIYGSRFWVRSVAKYSFINANDCRIKRWSSGFILFSSGNAELHACTCICECDISNTFTLYDSTIDDNVTSTNLKKFNSVITGSEVVSGTTTSRQAKVFDDSVELKKGIDITETPASDAQGVAFNGNTKIYEFAANILRIAIAGTDEWELTGSYFKSITLKAAYIRAGATAVSVNAYTFNGDVNTGMSSFNDDELSLVAGGIEAIKINEIAGIITNLFTDSYGSKQKSSDPLDPPAGQHQIWQSDGTGSGNDGDLMIKVTDSGGTTNISTFKAF